MQAFPSPFWHTWNFLTKFPISAAMPGQKYSQPHHRLTILSEDNELPPRLSVTPPNLPEQSAFPSVEQSSVPITCPGHISISILTEVDQWRVCALSGGDVNTVVQLDSWGELTSNASGNMVRGTHDRRLGLILLQGVAPSGVLHTLNIANYETEGRVLHHSSLNATCEKRGTQLHHGYETKNSSVINHLNTDMPTCVLMRTCQTFLHYTADATVVSDDFHPLSTHSPCTHK